MNNSKTESPKITKIILRSLLTIHLIVIAAYTAFILVKHHEIFKLTITFVMLIVYGFMGVWVLLINSILMVVYVLFSVVGSNKRQCFSIVSIWNSLYSYFLFSHCYPSAKMPNLIYQKCICLSYTWLSLRPYFLYTSWSHAYSMNRNTLIFYLNKMICHRPMQLFWPKDRSIINSLVNETHSIDCLYLCLII